MYKSFWDTFILPLTGILTSLLVWGLFSLALAWPVLLLWNWLMPVIFTLPTIGYWQSVGLMLLVSLLFRWHITIGAKKS